MLSRTEIDNILKWTATAVLIIGTGINNLGYQPLGPLLLLLGGAIWLIVAVRWRESALIVTNTVMVLTGVLALVYKHFA